MTQRMPYRVRAGFLFSISCISFRKATSTIAASAAVSVFFMPMLLRAIRLPIYGINLPEVLAPTASVCPGACLSTGTG